jgi:hypothetical protein
MPYCYRPETSGFGKLGKEAMFHLSPLPANIPCLRLFWDFSALAEEKKMDKNINDKSMDDEKAIAYDVSNRSAVEAIPIPTNPHTACESTPKTLDMPRSLLRQLWAAARRHQRQNPLFEIANLPLMSRNRIPKRRASVASISTTISPSKFTIAVDSILRSKSTPSVYPRSTTKCYPFEFKC